MESRDHAIMLVKSILKEDIVDQFHIKEVEAALEGYTIFTIHNRLGESMTMQNFFLEEADDVIYRVVASNLLITPPKSIRRVCHHPTIEKGLHEQKFTCKRCGLIADREYFRRESER